MRLNRSEQFVSFDYQRIQHDFVGHHDILDLASRESWVVHSGVVRSLSLLPVLHRQICDRLGSGRVSLALGLSFLDCVNTPSGKILHFDLII